MANDNDGKIKSKTWRICAIIILVLIGVGGILLSLAKGAVETPITEILNILLGQDNNIHSQIS